MSTRVRRYASNDALTEAAFDIATPAQTEKLKELLKTGWWKVTQTDCLMGCDSLIWIRGTTNQKNGACIMPDGRLHRVWKGEKIPYPKTLTI